MKIAVVGGGTTGLSTALVLGRAGLDVTLVEKDPHPPAIDTSTVESWQRPGTPQAHLPHAFVSRGRALLAERAPDVVAAILAADAVDFDVAASAPDGARTDDGDTLRAMFARRPLLESALWRAVERERGIELATATTVTGVAPGVVATTRGDVRAELIVDAGGRRSPIAEWLGAPKPLVEDCGVVYYSRYYRLRSGAELPASAWLWGPRAELPFTLAVVHLAERGVYSITFAIPTFDAELKALRAPAAFTALCEMLPAFAPWVDPERSEPASDVLAMGGLQNFLHEQSHAPGVVAVGDALCHTNAAYGWGMSLGLVHACTLADAIVRATSPDAAIASYHQDIAAETRARWELSVQLDRTRSRMYRGEPPLATDHYAAAQRALAPATMRDGDVFRAVIRVAMLLAGPDTLLDPRLHARAREVPAMAPPPGPTRADALAAIRAAI